MSPRNGGNPREDLSLAIHNVAGALPGWLCWGQGHRKPALWSLWGPVNTSRQACEMVWGIWPWPLTSRDFQGLGEGKRTPCGECLHLMLLETALWG